LVEIGVLRMARLASGMGGGNAARSARSGEMWQGRATFRTPERLVRCGDVEAPRDVRQAQMRAYRPRLRAVEQKKPEMMCLIQHG
tara:strand:+ start:315 stop:569 length:255 start_codon:yes stop_codon:yes gene_type:complete